MILMTPYREFSVKLTWNTQNLMVYGLIMQKTSILITLKKSKNTLSRALLTLHSDVCGLSRVKVTLSACAKTTYFFLNLRSTNGMDYRNRNMFLHFWERNPDLPVWTGINLNTPVLANLTLAVHFLPTVFY